MYNNKYLESSSWNEKNINLMSISDKVSSIRISHPPHATWYSSLSPSDILSDHGTATRLNRGLLEPIQFGSSVVAGISI